MNSLFNRVNVFVMLAAILTACTITTTKRKSPEFAASIETLSDTLNHLVNCEHINLEGKEITTNGKSSSELEVDILNAANLPSSEQEQDELTRRIAVEIKHALKNENSYDNYRVLFVKEQTSGSVTTTKSSGHVWRSAEL